MGCSSSTASSPAATTASVKKNDEDDKTPLSSSRGVPSSASLENNTNRPKKDTMETTTTTLKLGTKFQMRYACLSRRGRDPDDASKPNQDCYSVHHEFCDDESDTFFGVYDGHGPKGDACSQFVRQRLPDLAGQKIQKQQDDFLVLTANQIQTSLHEAHVQCNEELHAAKHIDDLHSGTTAVTMYMQGNHDCITICNVGDSRAVLGTTTTSSGDGGALRLRAVPLSKDHTPYRADEAQRCVQSGARILSFGQINEEATDDSETEDPPRVWAQKSKYPGTAFTRSIGDSLAETLGVFAEPEMLTLKFSEKEKVIVLASDGIFDVMTNQAVIDMCFQYYGRKDPAQACSVVIEHSRKEWLRNEGCIDGDEESANYDDMTMACIFVYNTELEVGDQATGTMTSLDAEPLAATAAVAATESSRPQLKRVRQKTLRNLDDM